MKVQRITLLALGGAFVGAATIACSDRDAVPKDQSSEAPASDVQADSAEPASDLSEPVVHHGHVHEPGSKVIDLDGAGLPPLPSSFGGRVFDSIVRVSPDGAVQRKLIETTVEQRAQTALMAKDLQGLVRSSKERPSRKRLDQWRASWGLPTREESRVILDDLMRAPFDIMLQGEMDESLRVELSGNEGLQLDVISNTSVLAAKGYDYLGTTDNGGPSGGICASYLDDPDTVIYWSQPNFQQHVLCFVGAYADASGTHTQVYWHFTHSVFWSGGTDVDSYSTSADWFCSRDANGDTFIGVASGGTPVLDSDTSNDWIDNKVGSCINPFATDPVAWV